MIRVKADPINKKAYIGIDNITRNHKKAIRNASFDIGKKSQNESRKNILTGKKTGRTYKIGGFVHRASAPGESPANITGSLAKSVDYDVRGHQQTEFGYKKLYGKFLEDGTVNMERRPNLQKVFDGNLQEYINLMVKHYENIRRR